MSPDPAGEPVDLFRPAPRNVAHGPYSRSDPATVARARSGRARPVAAPLVVPGRVVAPEPPPPVTPRVRAGRRAWLLAAALALAVYGAVVAVYLTEPPALVAEPLAAASTEAVPGVVAQPVETVRLPGPGSRDWVAPGVSPDGGLVRAELAQEAIEFRAANTQPGLPGPFGVSWSGGVAPEPVGSRAGMLGVRPGGWIQFVVRSTGTDADLVVHVAGEATVAVTAMGTTRTSTVSGAAAMVTVALGAGDATVTVAPAGLSEVGVVSAELR